jgi:hypothetical protein
LPAGLKAAHACRTLAVFVVLRRLEAAGTFRLATVRCNM